jgi:hypothetical protein
MCLTWNTLLSLLLYFQNIVQKQQLGCSTNVKLCSNNWVSRSPCNNDIISIRSNHLLRLGPLKLVDQTRQLNLATLGHGNTAGVAALTINNLEAPDLKKWGLAYPLPAISHAKSSHVNDMTESGEIWRKRTPPKNGD